MPKWIASWALLLLHTLAFSQEATEETPAEVELPAETELPTETEPPTVVEMPELKACIPPWVAAAPTPRIFPFHNALVLEIGAENETAQVHTLQGINHLHGSWDFEASRHFSIAMKADPRCLMAHWGMIMSMLDRSTESDPYRIATTERLLGLIADGEGSELEQGLAYGLIKYLESGPQAAAIAFRKVADKFPNDIQAEVFAALFSRGGYDSSGNITAAQAESEQRLLKLIERTPNHSIPLHALLLVRSEAPDILSSLELAQKLYDLAPKYPPYLQILGHYQWRSGAFEEAESSFALAETLYANWMKTDKISLTDCPQWTLVRGYRAVTMSSAEKFDEAIKLAAEISKTPFDIRRPSSPSNRQILWDAKTLPARIIMHRGEKTDPATALAALPHPDSLKALHKDSLFYWWVDGLRIALETKRLINEGEFEKANETLQALIFHGESMAKTQSVATTMGEHSEWKRSFYALESLAANLRGHLVLAGPSSSHGSAFNWFRAAADRQRAETLMKLPLILTPLSNDLGDYLLTRNQPAKALEAYEETLTKFPKDPRTLQRIEVARKQTEAK